MTSAVEYSRVPDYGATGLRDREREVRNPRRPAELPDALISKIFSYAPEGIVSKQFHKQYEAGTKETAQKVFSLYAVKMLFPKRIKENGDYTTKDLKELSKRMCSLLDIKAKSRRKEIQEQFAGKDKNRSIEYFEALSDELIRQIDLLPPAFDPLSKKDIFADLLNLMSTIPVLAVCMIVALLIVFGVAIFLNPFLLVIFIALICATCFLSHYAWNHLSRPTSNRLAWNVLQESGFLNLAFLRLLLRLSEVE
jgi:hypothetical protein